ncbi:MAG: hypothetical protein LAT76_04970 [Schleiferiaceae bacterium]|nr:hypothetical protein [Schleiferiaceae bacterium]
MKAILLSCVLLTSFSKVVAQQEDLTLTYANYNFWANQQIIHWLQTAPDSVWNAPIESSFPTLEATVYHLLNAEYGWMTVLNNKPWGNAEKPDSKEAMLELWTATSKLLAQDAKVWVVEHPDATRKLGEKETTLAEIIHHVCNHATYHRGQLITMGRQLGLEHPPRTDFIYFIRLPEVEQNRLLQQLQSE